MSGSWWDTHGRARTRTRSRSRVRVCARARVCARSHARASASVLTSSGDRTYVGARAITSASPCTHAHARARVHTQAHGRDQRATPVVTIAISPSISIHNNCHLHHEGEGGTYGPRWMSRGQPQTIHSHCIAL